MKRTLILVLLTVVTLAVVGLAGGTHDPILILGNGDFTADNGVVGGTGTSDDPYIITGWEINVPQDAEYGVKIENTSAHFVLRGVIIRGASAANGAAIRLGFVSGGRVEKCLISDSRNGIEVASSNDLTLTGNVIYIQGIGLRITGESANEYNLAIDQTNELNNNPIRYFYGKSGETVSGIESNNLYFAACKNMTITDNTITNGDGIQLAFVEDSTISGNAVYRTSPVLTEHGISLYRSDSNTVANNVLQNNRLAGMYVWLSSHNKLTDNQFLANDTGIILAASDENQVYDNMAFANPVGIEVRAGSTENDIARNIITHANTKYGIVLDQATGNTVEANAITDAETGIRLAEQGNNNTVTSNTIVKAAYALSVSGSNNEIEKNLIAQNTRGILFPETYGKVTVRGNSIHNNVFSDNSNHIYLNNDSQSNQIYLNTFLGGGTSLVEDYGHNTWAVNGEGNYWGDYQGADANNDGIGDDPVLIYPAAVADSAPIVSLAQATDNLGVLSTLPVDDLVIVLSDGSKIVLPVLRANTANGRFVGFRGYPPALINDAPGILFSFTDEATRRFTMETVPFGLDIAFFDASGAFAGSMAMEAQSKDLYTAKSPFQYALELQSGKIADLGIGDGAKLVDPAQAQQPSGENN
ncbi:MAG TPA: hypothetical protein ENL23_01300 [Candidatus Acetothermia bacterium]|nr:hypothetical protein [Candidatus Acetothermia bacterium]